VKKNRSIPDAVVIPVLAYPDVDEAVRWLAKAFGFVERLRIADHRAQLTFNGGAVVARDGGDGIDKVGTGVMVRVDDADALFARATAAGARVVHAPTTYQYGERQFSVLDIGGHRWDFSETVADSDPSTWGGKLIAP
jgi:uncharacterized glyoxalase superfamily protein PhnB